MPQKSTSTSRTNLLNSLGKRIAVARGKRGMTLDTLSRRMSISKGNLSDIEHGKRDPRYLTLLAIAEGLQVPLNDLLRHKARAK